MTWQKFTWKYTPTNQNRVICQQLWQANEKRLICLQGWQTNQKATDLLVILSNKLGAWIIESYSSVSALFWFPHQSIYFIDMADLCVDKFSCLANKSKGEQTSQNICRDICSWAGYIYAIQTTNIIKIVFCKLTSWALQSAYREFDRQILNWFNVRPLISCCISSEEPIDL